MGATTPVKHEPARARSRAARADSASVQGSPDLQLVCFRMGGEEFGLSIMRIREIVRPLRVARVPRAPSFVEGVVNLRGQILPVIDLRTRLELPKADDERRTRFLVTALTGFKVVFVVDEVNEVLRANVDAVLPAPSLVRGIDASYLLGVLPVGDRLIMLLHPERVLTTAEADELGRLTAAVAGGFVEEPAQ